MDPKARTLLEMIESAKKARESFIDTGREIAEFAYAKEHTKLHEAIGHKGNPFCATVAKTAEYLETVGPSLYQTNPDRRVISRPWASEEAKARNALMQDLLNYTSKETQLEDHSRRSINHALVYGAGVLWTGYNPKKRLVQSVWDSVENLLLDPDAGIPEEINWGARVRKKPKHWLRNRFKDKQKEIAGIQLEQGEKVTLYEVYCKIGLHNFAKQDAPMGGQDDAPRKYVVTDGGVILSEGEWEVPYFLDDKWPWELLYFRDGQGENGKECVWPTSPLQPGLGFQKALDWIYTWYLTKASQTTGTLLALIRQNGQGIDLDAFRRAMATARTTGRGVLEIEVSGEMVDFQKFITEFNLSVGIDEFERFVGIVERAFERATGLTEFVSAGQTKQQFRSAAEAEIKDRNSRTRFEDMRARVEAWCARVARKEAQAARFLLEPEDVGRIFGPQAAQLWSVLVPPMDIQMAQGMEQAAAAGITDRTAAQMFAQEQVQPGVVFEEWLLETDFEIESGTTRAKNLQQQQDAAGEFATIAFPAMMSGGFVVPALEGLKAWASVKDMPTSFIQAMDNAIMMAQQPPPPPPGMPADPMAGMSDPALLPPMMG
jgi:hypothetical protein